LAGISAYFSSFSPFFLKKGAPNRGVHAVELALETKFSPWSLRSAQIAYFREQIFEKTDRAGIIRIGKG
jgi:hypothetical protein